MGVGRKIKGGMGKEKDCGDREEAYIVLVTVQSICNTKVACANNEFVNC